MSRVGKMPIPIPSGTKVSIEDGCLIAEGPKGKNVQPIFDGFPVEMEDDQIVVSRPGEERDDRAKHGLLRALMANAVTGVTVGFSRELEVHGVGYKAEMKGRELHMALGYSPPGGLFTARGDQRRGRQEQQDHDQRYRSPEGRSGGGGDPQPAQARALQGQGDPLLRRSRAPQGR